MKIKEIIEGKEKMSEHKDGTYAGVNFSASTVTAINNFIKKYKIPKAVPNHKLHTTLLYSRKPLPDYKAMGEITPPYVGTPKHFEIWKTRDTQANCLVLKYTCSDLVKRHKFLMKEHGATFDFDEFIPHITLSYDIGDMTLEDIGKPSEIGKILINKEYSQPLDMDWSKKV